MVRTRAGANTRTLAVGRRRPRGLDLALVLVAVLAAAFYCWTAASSKPFRFGADNTDIYNQNTDSILMGQASYPVRPPAGLLKLRDPYNPRDNTAYQSGRYADLHDVSLYKGKLYGYWGIAPALTLFLPWRILPVGELPESLGLAIFGFMALVFSLLLLRLLVRRLLPNTPAWAVVLGAVGLSFGTAVPLLLGDSNQYAVAVAGGACFLTAGLYLLARELLSERARLRGVAVASLCFGLAFNSRPSLIVSGGILVGLAVIGHRLYSARGASRRRFAAALLCPFAACVVLTLAWNAVRFDSPFEFGQKYQIAGAENRKKALYQLSYLPPGIYNFALAPPRLILAFPYVISPPPPSYPGTLPHGYDGTKRRNASPAEATAGIVPTAPIVLFALALPFLWRRRRADEKAILAVVSTLVGLGMAIILVLAFILWGTTERYEVDFDLLLIMGGLLSWLAVLRRAGTPRRRRLVAVAGTLTALWTVFCGVGLSFTANEKLMEVCPICAYKNLHHPQRVRDLENLTAPLPTLVAMLVGHPLIATIESSTPAVLRSVNYATFTAAGASATLSGGPVTVTVYAPGSQDLALQATVHPQASAPVSACPSAHRLPRVAPTVRRLRVVPGRVLGFIDHSQIAGGSALFCGWAANVSDHQVAGSVLVFSDGLFVGAVKPRISRPDVARARRVGSTSGFSLRLPLSVVARRGQKEKVQLFGVERGVASPLAFACMSSPQDFGCAGGPAVPGGARLSLVVRSPGRPPVTVPAVRGVERFPIHLDWGVNRIRLDLMGTAGTVRLAHIELVG